MITKESAKKAIHPKQTSLKQPSICGKLVCINVWENS